MMAMRIPSLLLALAMASLGCGDGSGPGGNGDTDRPVITGCVVNDGALFTLSRTVTLGVSATDNEGSAGMTMRLASDSAFAGSAWVPYQNPTAYLMPTGDGSKTVFVQVRDASGNQSHTASDQIVLAEHSTVVYFDPASVELSASETATARLVVENAIGMVSARFQLLFDPDMLEITELNVDLGTEHLLSSTGASLIVSDSRCDNEFGSMEIGALGQKNGFVGVSGAGPYAELVLRAKMPMAGPVPLTIAEHEIYCAPLSNPPVPFENVFIFDETVQ